MTGLAQSRRRYPPRPINVNWSSDIAGRSTPSAPPLRVRWLCRAQCVDRSRFVGGIARPAERCPCSHLSVLLQMVFTDDAPRQAFSEIPCPPTKARFFAVIGIQINLR